MPTSTADLAAARSLLANERYGTFCTLHAGQGGWPFGSLVPYAVLSNGDPVVMLSAIAEHTRNVAADARVTLFVADSKAADRPQAGARLAFMARAEVATGPASAPAEAAYFGRFPEARGHFSAHDFALYVLRVERIRWIAGFGSMGWIDRKDWALPAAVTPEANPLAAHAKPISDHMNRDHPDSLVVLARRYANVTATAATMVGLDTKGLDLDVEGKRVRIDFPRAVSTPDEVRQVVTGMLGHARRG